MIPFDQIYNYILNLANRKVNLFFLKDFRTRGLEEFQILITRSERHKRLWPIIICHDQELLDYDRHLDCNLAGTEWFEKAKDRCVSTDLNLRWLSWSNIHDSFIIVHSEKNSRQVEKYQDQGNIMVHFWSHALLARDWYRYAEHDPTVGRIGVPKRDFLVYSRGWSGTREYRIKFAEMMLERDLVDHSIYRIAKIENNLSLDEHVIIDPRYHTTKIKDIFQQIPDCTVDSDSSARYCVDDYNKTNISVILETCFSENTIHLTEKTLRPIALGHPFLLVAGPGSLAYLKSYGFETFDKAGLDETYDSIQDPIERLKSVADEMQRISRLSPDLKNKLLKEISLIASRNRERFFSNGFYQQLIEELNVGILQALDSVRRGSVGRKFLSELKLRRAVKGRDYYKQRVLDRPSYVRDLRIYRKSYSRFFNHTRPFRS